jgi:hypothetical protein
MANEVLVDVTDGIMTVTLNRPEAKNAANTMNARTLLISKIVPPLFFVLDRRAEEFEPMTDQAEPQLAGDSLL